MKSSNRFRVIAMGIALGLMALAMPGLAVAKKNGNQKQAKPKTQKVAIGFTAVNGGQRVSCARPITGLGTTSRNARLKDLRFYVSGVKLLRKGGGSVNVKLPRRSKWSTTKGKAAVTMIDLENGAGECAAAGTKAMNSQVRGTVPRGKYVGVRYSVSVPESLNHTDVTAVPAPLNMTAMAWSWQAGRKYMQVELNEDGGPAWASKTFFLHVGSTDCKGNPAAGEKTKCGLPNRNQVTLKKFNPAKQRVALDFRKLFGGVDLSGGGSMEGHGESGGHGGMGGMEGMSMGGCMSAPSSHDCGPLFAALGMKLGSKAKTAQTAFRVVRK